MTAEHQDCDRVKPRDHNGAGYELGAGAIAAALLALVFLLAWWNRFLGASSNGWHFFYGSRIFAGEIPYRDFYMYVPPLHPLKFTALIALFGESLIAGRVVAVAERVALAVLLFLWLARLFPALRALLGATVAILVFCGDFADALTLHHHDSVLWAVVSGLLASLALDRTQPGSRRLLGLASGAAAGLCLLAKQTTGAGVFLVVGAILGLASWRKRGRAADATLPLFFAAGWLLPVGLIALWLARHGAFLAFVDQVFLNGPSSKGPLLSVLARPLSVEPGRFLFCVLPAVFAFIAVHQFPSSGARPGTEARRSRHELIKAAALAGAAIGLPMALCFSNAEFRGSVSACRVIEVASLYFAFLGSGALFLQHLWRARKPDCGDEEIQMTLISGVSFAIAYMLSLSWPAYEPMALPALGLLASWSLHRLAPSQIPLRAGRGARLLFRLAPCVAAAAIAIVIAAAVWLKLTTPFTWEGWREPRVNRATAASRLPALRGFRLSPSTADFVDRITSLIRANSTDRDTVFVFPHMPIFYTLSGRKPPTFAYVHWFDVTPDGVARRDARALRSRPPAVIVRMELAEEHLRFLEKWFRGSGSSGQRELISAIQELCQSYELAATLKAPGETREVKVFVRR